MFLFDKFTALIFIYDVREREEIEQILNKSIRCIYGENQKTPKYIIQHETKKKKNQ